MSLQSSDKEAAAHAVAPRVTLADIEAAIAARYDTTADRAVAGLTSTTIAESAPRANLWLLSICILVMKNGFVVVGTSAPASPDNFNAELGRNLAYEHAVRQLWPLMGFALRDKLAYPPVVYPPQETGGDAAAGT
jgi:hypothetical protein